MLWRMIKSMAKIKKNGPITQSEIEFVKLNVKNMSAQEMADILGRTVEAITKVMGQIDTIGYKSEILDLKKRADWKDIQQEFTEEEIETFKAHWNGTVQQFKEEIHYTEGLQIMSAIKHLILSDRVLKDQMNIKRQVARIDAEIEKERNQDPPNFDVIRNLETQLASYAMAEQANSKEFREGNTKLMAVLKELKATREQRMAKVEDMKTNFGRFMRTIIEDPTIKRNYGVYMEKMRLAAEQEYRRLGNLFKFANNEVDRPILNSETVDFYDEEISEEKDEENA